MIEKPNESIVNKLGLKEQRQIGLKLIDMGVSGIITYAPAGNDNLSVVMREIRPQILEIYNFTDNEFPGTRSEFLDKLRQLCDQLPDFGIGFSNYVYDHEEADWKGHEDPKKAEKTAFRWKIKSTLSKVRSIF